MRNVKRLETECPTQPLSNSCLSQEQGGTPADRSELSISLLSCCNKCGVSHSPSSFSPHSQITPWSRVLPEKLKHPKLLKKFPAFYGTRRFITAFIRARHLSLSLARLIQSIIPYTTSRRSILILSSPLRLGLPSGLLPSGFPTKALYVPLLSPIRATYSAHLSLLDLITRMMFGKILIWH